MCTTEYVDVQSASYPEEGQIHEEMMLEVAKSGRHRLSHHDKKYRRTDGPNRTLSSLRRNHKNDDKALNGAGRREPELYE